MGSAHSQDDLKIYESDEEEEELVDGDRRLKSPSSLDEVESKLRALKLKYPSTEQAPPNSSVDLLRYINGNTPKAKWVAAENSTSYCFAKSSPEDGGGDSEKEWWVLKVGSKIREKVSNEMRLKAYKDQRVEFVANGGYWALRFTRPSST